MDRPAQNVSLGQVHTSIHWENADYDVDACVQVMVVKLQDRPAITFDVLSVDIGITPSKTIPGSSSIATPVKPISM